MKTFTIFFLSVALAGATVPAKAFKGSDNGSIIEFLNSLNRQGVTSVEFEGILVNTEVYNDAGGAYVTLHPTASIAAKGLVEGLFWPFPHSLELYKDAPPFRLYLNLTDDSSGRFSRATFEGGAFYLGNERTAHVFSENNFELPVDKGALIVDASAFATMFDEWTACKVIQRYGNCSMRHYISFFGDRCLISNSEETVSVNLWSALEVASSGLCK